MAKLQVRCGWSEATRSAKSISAYLQGWECVAEHRENSPIPRPECY